MVHPTAMLCSEVMIQETEYHSESLLGVVIDYAYELQQPENLKGPPTTT